MKNLAVGIPIAPQGGFKGFGPLGNPGGAYDIIFANFLSTVIGVMTIVAFIWFIFIFLMGAIGIISSGGDKGAYEAARKKITTGLIGIVVVIAAIFILNLIGTILGIPILNFLYLFTVLVNS